MQLEVEELLKRWIDPDYSQSSLPLSVLVKWLETWWQSYTSLQLERYTVAPFSGQYSPPVVPANIAFCLSHQCFSVCFTEQHSYNYFTIVAAFFRLWQLCLVRISIIQSCFDPQSTQTFFSTFYTFWFNCKSSFHTFKKDHKWSSEHKCQALDWAVAVLVSKTENYSTQI